jgi:hypothetical protein
VFTGASVIAPLPEAVTLGPLMGPLILLVQLKVVPPMVEVGVKLRDEALQIVVSS